MVNLFTRQCEPIPLTHQATEYHISPDTRRPRALEIWSIERVRELRSDGSLRPWRPFYRHPAEAPTENEPAGFFNILRRESPAPLTGTDVFLAPFDPELSVDRQADTVLSIDALCTNRDLPAELPYGGGQPHLHLAEGVSAVTAVTCMTAPTPSLRAPLREHRSWRLISHLSLGHLSVVGGPQAAEALRDVLRLYDLRDSAETRGAIEGLVGVRSAPEPRGRPALAPEDFVAASMSRSNSTPAPGRRTVCSCWRPSSNASWRCTRPSTPSSGPRRCCGGAPASSRNSRHAPARVNCCERASDRAEDRPHLRGAGIDDGPDLGRDPGSGRGTRPHPQPEARAVLAADADGGAATLRLRRGGCDPDARGEACRPRRGRALSRRGRPWLRSQRCAGRRTRRTRPARNNRPHRAVGSIRRPAAALYRDGQCRTAPPLPGAGRFLRPSGPAADRAFRPCRHQVPAASGGRYGSSGTGWIRRRAGGQSARYSAGAHRLRHAASGAPPRRRGPIRCCSIPACSPPIPAPPTGSAPSCPIGSASASKSSSLPGHGSPSAGRRCPHSQQAIVPAISIASASMPRSATAPGMCNPASCCGSARWI